MSSKSCAVESSDAASENCSGTPIFITGRSGFFYVFFFCASVVLLHQENTFFSGAGDGRGLVSSVASCIWTFGRIVAQRQTFSGELDERSVSRSNVEIDLNHAALDSRTIIADDREVLGEIIGAAVVDPRVLRPVGYKQTKYVCWAVCLVILLFGYHPLCCVCSFSGTWSCSTAGAVAQSFPEKNRWQLLPWFAFSG